MNTGKRLLSLNLALLMAVTLLLPASKSGAAATAKPAVAAREVTQEEPKAKPKGKDLSFATLEDLPAELPLLPAEPEQPEQPPMEELPTETIPPAELAGKTAETTSTVKVNGVVVRDGEEGAGWRCYGDYLRLEGFQGTSIEVIGDLTISNHGISTINAVGINGPAISATGNLSIQNSGIFNVYAWATATDLHSGIKANGKIDIYNEERAKVFVSGGSRSPNDANKAPGVDTAGQLKVTGIGGFFEALGTPAVRCSSLQYDSKALNCFVGESKETAVKTSYQNQKYLRLEFATVTLYMNGNGGTLDGYTQRSIDNHYGGWIYNHFIQECIYPTRVHIGWSTNQNGVGGTWYDPKGDMIKMESDTGRIDLYAQWQQVNESRRVLFSGQGSTFEDGRGAKAIGFEPGQSVDVPSITQPAAKTVLLGWTEYRGCYLDEETRWAFPGDKLNTATDKNFYARWQSTDKPYIRYEGGDGKSAYGSSKLYQIVEGTSTNLHLFNSTTFTRSGSNKIIYGWSTNPDGTGTRHLVGTELLRESLPKGETKLYAVWGDPVSVLLKPGNIQYTGKAMEWSQKVVATIKAGDTVIENPNLYYYYYRDSAGKHTDWDISLCGTYYMRGDFWGDQEKWCPPAKSEIVPFTIGKGTAKISLPSASPVALWNGQSVTLPPSTVTMSGEPYTLEKPSYEYRSGNNWMPGLPSALGAHQIRALLPGTSNYDAASTEATLNISNFVAQNGTVRGNVDVALDGKVTGKTAVLIALYSTATGRMNAIAQREVTVKNGEQTIALRDIALSDPRGDGDKVKIFLMDSTNTLKPKMTLYEYRVR